MKSPIKGMTKKTPGHRKGIWQLGESYQKLSTLLNAMQLYVPGFIWKLKTQPANE